MSHEKTGQSATNANRQIRPLQDQLSADVAIFLNRLIREVNGQQTEMRTHQDRPEPSREATTIPVSTKELVMKVFLDAEENYSVSGYNVRAHDCFGAIYLGLDKGPEYTRQSSRINEAIMNISGAQAFELALGETRRAIAINPRAEDTDVTVSVLAAVCRTWFDLPDMTHVVEAGVRSENFTPPPRCPGDYMFPSGYIFYPEPGDYLSAAGPACGRILKAAVLDYVTDLRASGTLPSGLLSRAIFEALPQNENDLVARTIIGVMMGMIPTVYFNLLTTLESWRADDGKIFMERQEALRQQGGSDPFLRASAALKLQLIQSIQSDPMPPAVWRIAVQDHALGAEQVRRGDKIALNIASATREDLHMGTTDAFAVFGGNRRTSPHPTHACPAYAAALGIMLGVINGIMEPTDVAATS